MTNTQCGYIAILGRPNVGKSTLLNGILKKKISITSPKPQTTRHQIIGIKTIDSIQAVYIDTPGIHHIEKKAINRYLNRLASGIIPDANIIIFMIEALKFNQEDQLVLEKIKLSQTKAPVILVINKVDQVKDKIVLLPFINKLKELYNFEHIFPFSAIERDQIILLEKHIMPLLPEGQFLFSDKQFTDKDERFQITELIREQIILLTEQELPFSTTVEIESLEHTDKLITINAIIWVERQGQKMIVIGTGGGRLKTIGTRARKEIELLLSKKVFLRLWVKVKPKWTNDENFLKNAGYF